MEIFTFRAQFLPWFLLLFVVIFGYDAQDDVIGAFVGHIYYFLAEVLPQIPETFKFEVLKPPRWLVHFCDYFSVHEFGMFDDPDLFGRGGGGWFFVDEEDDGQMLADNPELFD